jgi:arylsulfatase A-like enzyme
MVVLHKSAQLCVTLVTIASIGLLACHGPGRTGPSAAEPAPNVLLVVLDTLRYDATGLSERNGQTPVLERLAAHGVEFTRSYSTHDHTVPSHFSLFTGFVDGRRTALDRAEFGLAYQLGQQGYATFGISANGSVNKTVLPVVGGFSQYVCLYDRWVGIGDSHKERILPSIDRRISHWGGRLNDYNRGLVFTSVERVLPKLRRFLKNEKGKNRPFFAFVNLMEPHDPYFPTIDDERAQRCLRDLPEGFDPDIRYRPLPEFLKHPETMSDPARRASIEERLARAGRPWCLADDLTEPQLEVYRCRYDAEVREADAALGSLLRVLQDQGADESTIVIVTSDHGEAFGEAGFVTHAVSEAGDLEATQRVPLVMGLPGHYGLRPTRVDEATTSADVAPTLYDLLGIDWHPLIGAGATGNVGRSLVAFLGIERPPRTRQLSLPSEGLRARIMVPASTATAPEEEVERLRALGYVE